MKTHKKPALTANRFICAASVVFIGNNNPKAWPTQIQDVLIQASEHVVGIWMHAGRDSRECKYTSYKTIEDLNKDFRIITSNDYYSGQPKRL